MNRLILVIIFFICCTVWAQPTSFRLHSHNDYSQLVPFWNAYAQGMRSIEIDLVLQHNQLYVAHDIEDANPLRTIERLYLNPLSDVAELGLGQVKGLQFLIDLKGDADRSMALLVPILKNYEDIILEHDIRFVISGNKPNVVLFSRMPAYILDDYQLLELPTDPSVLERIAMVSYNFGEFSSWGGVGQIPDSDLHLLKGIVDDVHRIGKPIRFWATPDTPEAWSFLFDLGVDFINTDKPCELRVYVTQQIHK